MSVRKMSSEKSLVGEKRPKFLLKKIASLSFSDDLDEISAEAESDCLRHRRRRRRLHHLRVFRSLTNNFYFWG